MRKLGSAANMILRRFGYEIRSVRRNAGFRPSEKTKGTIVELLGPSGIGKTTLGKQVIEKEWSRLWNYGYPAARHPPGPCPLDHFYERLIEKKLAWVYSQNYALSTKLSHSGFFSRRLQEDRTIICDRLWLEGGLFLDDGIMHNFSKQLIETMETDEISNAVKTLFFSPRTCVNLVASPDTVMARLHRRNETEPGGGNDWSKILGSNLTTDRIRRSLEQKKKLCQVAREAGAAVFEIDLDKEDKVIADKARSIESDVISTSHRRMERMRELIGTFEGKRKC